MKQLILFTLVLTTALTSTAQDSIQAVFSVLDICDGSEAVFTNTSKVPSKFGSANYTWTFGDGTTSTSQFPTHVYKLDDPAYGQSFTIKLVVQSKSFPMEIDSTFRVIEVFPNPNAYFEWDVINYGNTQEVVIDSQATTDTSNLYQWTLAGSVKSSEVSPVFPHEKVSPYLDGSTYDFTLFIRTVNSCESTYKTDFSYNPLSVSNTKISKVKIYPNPSSGELFFSTSLSDVKVRDLRGAEVYNQAGVSTSIDLNLSPGVYILEATKDAKHVAQRLVIE